MQSVPVNQRTSITVNQKDPAQGNLLLTAPVSRTTILEEELKMTGTQKKIKEQ